LFPKRHKKSSIKNTCREVEIAQKYEFKEHKGRCHFKLCKILSEEFPTTKFSWTNPRFGFKKFMLTEKN
jgi:hypothetical protein